MIQIRNSRQRCVLELYDHAIFFSLVCYRNNLFTSNEPEKIIEFYNGFDNRDQLIQWMKERPKGASYIHEVEGDKDIIVVIPTADFNGKYARTCREEIFKGLHMIFVESGENPDPYFNYAHNCNVGIKKAMEYNPKWVVVSNDDMATIDSVSKLIFRLGSIQDRSVVFTAPRGKYHSYPTKVGKRSHLKLLYYMTKGDRGLTLYKLESKIQKKFLSPYTIENMSLYHRFFNRETVRFVNIGAFGILNSDFLKKRSCKLFDETYINGIEDADISLSIKKDRIDFGVVNFRIGDLVGSSLGSYSKNRQIRDFINQVYFNSKYTEYLMQMGK